MPKRLISSYRQSRHLVNYFTQVFCVDIVFDHVSRASIAIYGGVSETVVLWSI